MNSPSVPDWSVDSTTQLSTLETDIEISDEDSVVHRPTPPSSPPTFNPDMTTQAWSPTTDFAFYTNTKPVSFKDPSCRDMRYSCAFWLKHNRKVCFEQLSFMRAQCAFTCRFCTPHANFRESDSIS
uniref:ShKT domain-containing protein n=1 Tax=Heterorhabditis bacteriophora TaxID=37862 RepID=A0A1I7WNE1_HETBA